MSKKKKKPDWVNIPFYQDTLNGFCKPANISFIGREVSQLVKAIKCLIRDNAIEPCDLKQKVAYKYKVSDLKKILKEKDEKTTGAKGELIDRVLLVAKREMEDATKDDPIYCCSPFGLSLVAEFEECKEEVKKAAKEKSFKAFVENKAAKAYRHYASFNKSYGSKDHYDSRIEFKKETIERLKRLLACEPTALKKLEPRKLVQLKAATAMDELWGVQGHNKNSPWLGDDFLVPSMSNYRAMKILYRNYLFRDRVSDVIEIYGNDPYVETTLVFNELDTCDSCMQLNGKTFKIEEIPDIPTFGCTSASGCICSLETERNRECLKDKEYMKHYTDQLEELSDFDSKDLDRCSEKSFSCSEEKKDPGNHLLEIGDPVTAMRELKSMLDQGIIDEDEFKKRKELLLSLM